MGIYRVRSRAGGVAVVGASLNLPAVLNRHRAELRLGSHRNRALQREWDEQGEGALEFEVLDTLEPAQEEGRDPRVELEALEALWMERLAEEDGG